MFRLHLSAFILLAFLSTCGGPITNLPAPQVTQGPTASPAATAKGPPPTPVCNDVSAAPPHYDLDLGLDYTAHTAEVFETITVVNGSTDTWRDLALVVSANAQPDQFALRRLATDGYPANYALDGVALRLILPAPVDPGCRLTVEVDYTLTLPRLDASTFGWRGVLGWTNRQTLLGHWYATLAPYRAGAGWIAHPPAEQGEFETTEASEVSVTLELTGEQTGLTVVGSAAPGVCPAEAQATAEATCFALSGVRHFALAVSDQMEVAAAAAGSATITAMYFPEHSTAGKASLRAAREAFGLYRDRFGPVPYTWLAVVEADIPDGMEFTGLFFLGKPYYAEFDGSPQNYLTVLSVHETAHQWWYSLVGNDPATEPWLDEALATYSEEIFFEATYPDLLEWWWSFRVWGYLPQGSVGSDIYLSDDFRPYVDAVYLNGAQFIHALRGETGDAAFFDFLKAYAERGAGRIVTAEDFWATYAEFGNAEGNNARREYFEQP